MASTFVSYVEVPLTQGVVALVDVADLPVVSAHKWHASRNGSQVYAATNVRKAGGGYTRLYMHRLLMGDPPDAARTLLDHANHVGVDNRRSNLRWCNHLENALNTRSTTRGAHLRGVFRQGNSWVVKIRRNYIGCFASEAAAVEAAKDAAGRIFAGNETFVVEGRL